MADQKISALTAASAAAAADEFAINEATTSKKLTVAQLVEWIPISKTAYSAQTADITISSLTGNTDLAYKIMVEGKLVPSPGGDYNVTVRPNGDTTAGNYINSRHYSDGSAHAVDNPAGAGLVLCNNVWSGNTSVIGEMIFSAKDRDVARPYNCHWSAIRLAGGTNSYMLTSGGYWSNTADEVTSLVINLSSDAFTGTIAVFKKA